MVRRSRNEPEMVELRYDGLNFLAVGAHKVGDFSAGVSCPGAWCELKHLWAGPSRLGGESRMRMVRIFSLS